MDLAIYISELLGFKGEVNVPGLGCFAQKRISGYYNEDEGKFYPPSHEVTFDPIATDDNGLANYITLKKNISQASAKYFIEKYVTGVKQQASNGKADMQGLGYLYYEYAALAFKPNAILGNDPALYGLTPIKAARADQTPAATAEPEFPPLIEEKAPADEPPVVPQEVGVPEEIVTTPQEEVTVPEDEVTVPEDEMPEEEVADIPPTVISGDELTEEEYTIGDEDTGRKNGPWVIVLTMVIIALLALTGIYLYNPTLIGLKKRTDTTTYIVRHGPVPGLPKSSTPLKKDSTSKVTPPGQTIQPAVDTFAVKHYDVSGGSFASVSNFDKALKNYASLGLHPRIAKQAGNQHQIILSTLFNYGDAKKTRDSILNIKGITKRRIFIQTYIPKK